MRQVFKIHRFKVQRWTLLGLHRSGALRTGTSSSIPQCVLGLWCSAKLLRDRIFTDWPFTKFRGNNFRRWRIVVSHAHSDAAATPTIVLVMYKDIPIHIVKIVVTRVETSCLAEMATETFIIEAMVCWYLVYQSSWDATVT